MEERARRITLGRYLLVAVLLLFAGTLVVRGARLLAPSPVDRGLAPNLTLNTFDGRSISLEALRGRPVVVNFWASWCGPCRSEATLLEEGWQRARADGVVFLGVAIDDTEAAARRFVDEFDVTWPTGLDIDNEWDRAFRVRGLPETFFIDRQGRIVDHVSGALPTLRSLERRIAAMAP